MMNPCIDLDRADALLPDRVGTKAAVLARLRMAGFAVPEGLVLPTGTVGVWDGDPPVEVVDFARQVCQRWDGPLAVRSSASWEDLATSARAGQTLTVLHVNGAEQVVKAIHRCLRTAEEVLDATRLAILVQPMLAPTAAGVAFTADPITGDRDAVAISAVRGVAEPIVGGVAAGEEVQVRAGVVSGPGEVLDAAGARRVASSARALEALLGGPQDVEWALVDGAVHILQARPITVLPTRPTYPPGGGWQKDVAHYAEPLTPFGWALLERASTVVPEVFGEAGLMINGLEEVLVGGEVYGRVSPVVGSAEPGPAPPPRLLGLLARLVPAVRARALAARHLLSRDVPQEWTVQWERRRPTYIDDIGRLRGQDLSALSVADLISHFRRLEALVVEGNRLHFRVIVAYFLTLHALHGLLEGVDSWDEADTGALLAGSSPATRASEADMAVIRARLTKASRSALEDRPRHPLAQLAAVDPALADDVRSWMDTHGWRALNYDAGRPVLAERPALVTRLMLAHPTVVDPQEAKRAADTAREALPATVRPDFDRALARARHCYPLREDTAIVAGDQPLGLARRWLREAGERLVRQRALATVDASAYLTSGEVITALEGGLSADEAHELVARRRGEEAWVRAHPGPLTLGPQGGGPPDLSHAPGPLRQVNEAAMWFVGLEYPGLTASPASDQASVLVRGIGASPGVAEGPVRVVRDHHDLDLVHDGEVLVCQTSTPAWVPLFPLLSAIVADGGGALSHAAIAAREHGLPAVVGTQEATALLQPGRRVRVDGRAGTVSAV